MNKIATAIAMALLVAASSAASAAVCPVQVGEIAQYVEPKDVYNELKALSFRKSEYDTAGEFEVRVAEALKHEAATTTYLLRSHYYSGGLTYVAEREEFIVEQSAWDGLSFWSSWDFSSALSGGKLSVLMAELLQREWFGIEGMESSFEPVQGVELDSVSVSQFESDAYVVFDKMLPGPLRGGSLFDGSRWKCELTSESSEKCAIRLSVERENARSAKEGLSVGIVARPKWPLAAAGTSMNSPLITNYHVIVADILCAVLAGPDGRVIKTIDANP